MARKFYWQPELSIAIIYWSTTFIFFFLGFIFILEKSSFHWKSYLTFFLFFTLFMLSRKRYIRFSETEITISYLIYWHTTSLSYSEVENIEWRKNRLSFDYRGKTFEGSFFSKQKAECNLILKQKFPEILMNGEG